MAQANTATSTTNGQAAGCNTRSPRRMWITATPAQPITNQAPHDLSRLKRNAPRRNVNSRTKMAPHSISSAWVRITLAIDSPRGRRRHSLSDRGHRQANDQRSSGERSRPGIGEWAYAPQLELTESRAELVAHHQADHKQQHPRKDLQVRTSDYEYQRTAQRTGRRVPIHAGHETGDADASTCGANRQPG